MKTGLTHKKSLDKKVRKTVLKGSAKGANSQTNFYENLSVAERYVLGAIEDLFAGRKISAVPKGLWPEVRKELQMQSIEGLFSDHLDEMNLAQNEQNEYLHDIALGIQNWHYVTSAHAKLAALFASTDIPFVVLKGPAAAMNYPNPELRNMGDIDLLVSPENFDKAIQIMVADGWKSGELLDVYRRHAELQKTGYPEVELHLHFSYQYSEEQAKKADQYLYDAIAHAKNVEVGGYTIPVLPPLENGMILLRHLNFHLSGSAEGVGLRHVLDWMMFVEKWLDDDAWNNGFQAVAKREKLDKLAQVTTAACRQFLGLQKQISWCDNVDKKAAEMLLIRVVLMGNMGRKSRSAAKTSQLVLKRLRSPKEAYDFLSVAGASHWEPARKHKWLAPAACLYELGYLARRGHEKGIRVAHVSELSARAENEVKLLKEIGVINPYKS